MHLRPPQTAALAALAGLAGAPAGGQAPAGLTFDTPFPSYCFQLATGVGKTRLMGAAMALLYRMHSWRHFLLLAPGETIYTKLRHELAPHHSKYLFAGLPDFDRSLALTGEDYTFRARELRSHAGPVVCLFNIQKIFNPRQDRRFRFHRFLESLGASFAELLQRRDDLVILMDESHRYRGPASLQAMADLQPRLGLEFTATPAYTGNVVLRYDLGQAMRDGLIKEVRPLYRENAALAAAGLEEQKLADGLTRHRHKRAALAAYCANHGLPPVKPLALVSAAGIGHARAVQARVEAIWGGEFAGRTLLVHSQSEDRELARLLEVEDPASPVEVVIHVNKLREGWDVRNIYTIIPLRASVSEVLTEQTIGRGVRLPFARRTGDPEVDGLDVICYQPGRDNYARIIRTAWAPAARALRDDEQIRPAVVELAPDMKTRAAYDVPAPVVQARVQTRAWLDIPVPGGVPEAVRAPVAALVAQMDELTPADAPAVAALVQAYPAESPLPGAGALRELAGRVRACLREESRLEFAVSGERVRWRPWRAVAGDGALVPAARSIFPQCLAAGPAARRLAAALDDHPDVLAWLCPPPGQMIILTAAGAVTPDFIVRTGSGSRIVCLAAGPATLAGLAAWCSAVTADGRWGPWAVAEPAQFA